MMPGKRVDWMGLVSGILLIAVVPLSFYTPWWQLRLGDFGSANFSLLNTHFSFLGLTFLIPLLTALNISSLLLLSLSAVLMMVYALNPTKDSSRQLLSWSYKKPLFILLSFTVGLIALSQLVSFIAHQFAHIDLALPIIGTSLIQIPSELLGGVSGVQIGIEVSAGFQWTFFLALAATILCLATKLSQGKASPIAQPPAAAASASSDR